MTCCFGRACGAIPVKLSLIAFLVRRGRRGGGVLTSCLLTLVVPPAIYRWFEPTILDVEV